MSHKQEQSHIQVRIDEKTKRKAKKTLEELGLDLSSAVKLFLRNVIITESIPFDIRTKNGFTLSQEAMMVKEADEALKKGKQYTSYNDMVKDITV